MQRSLWQRFVGSRSSTTPPSRSGKRRATFRPRLESLEDLVLLSGVTFVPTDIRILNPTIFQQTTFGSPWGLTPAQIRHAYGFDQISFQNGTVAGNGAGQTIAIVDAYDDPSIANDLAVFDQEFGLAPPPSFVKVGLNANDVASTTSFPTPDAGWAGEIELDVEWAHAIAPGAKIMLVEANSSSGNDLLNAINYARNQPGVVAVSMSWGASEFSGEQSYDSYFTTPAGHTGVTFFGSSGDSGSPGIWPAMSSNVVGVGGTSLNVDAAGDYLGETAWSGSGGGLSPYETAPGYQQGLIIHNGNSIISSNGHRAGPDVAFDADPNTGVAVYGSYGWGGWAQIGGTSAAAPQWAGLMAITDQGRALAGEGSLDGATQTLPDLYQLPAADFHDVTAGSNGGYQAGPGFDLTTGRGSPVANLVVRDLIGPGQPPPPPASPKPPTVATAAHVVSQTSKTVNLAVLGADAAGEASLTYTWSLLGAVPGTVYANVNGTNAAKNITATFTATGVYTFRVTITDAAGLSTTSQVTVTINQVLTSLAVTPGSVTVTAGRTQQFTATEWDQFGHALTTQPKISWSLLSGGRSTITGLGLFTASGTPGNVLVQASAGGLTVSALVTIKASPAAFANYGSYSSLAALLDAVAHHYVW